MRRLLPVLLCSVALLSCRDGRKLAQIEIAEYSSETGWIVALDDRYDKWFRSYSAVILENTDGTDIIRDGAVIGHDGKALVVMGGGIRIVETSTGKNTGRIKPGDGGRCVSMDLDTLNGMLIRPDTWG